jgi:TPP-dependent 2-oxoacid decarboxylase
MNHPTTVSEYLIQRLSDHGVEHVFGVPGDYILRFFQQLERSPIKVVNTCDEQGAGFAADAYARLHGLGVVCITYCVGGLKVANTTAQAFAEKSPVVVISGAPGRLERQKNPLLHHKVRDFDTQLNIFRHLTVASTDLMDAHNACQEIDRVLDAALRYKRPVYIELPRDLTSLTCPIYRRPEPPATRSDREALQEALAETCARIRRARQPVFIAGVELSRFNLVESFLQMVTRTGIPFASTLLGKSAVREDHPLYLGVYEGALGHPQVRQYVEESDCVVLCGALLTDVNLGIYTAKLNQAQLVSLGSETTSIGYHSYPDVFLADVLAGLLSETLLCRQSELPSDPPAPEFSAGNGPITINRMIQALQTLLDEQTLLLADPGEALFAAAELKVHHAGAFIASSYYTSMGFAVPGAIGAQLARPDLRPVVLVGDGAFQMTGMELATAARFGLTPIVIVLNNRGYGTERPMLDGAFNDIPLWRFSRLPDFLGSGRGLEVRTEKEFVDALVQARDDTSTWTILDVLLDPSDSSTALQRLTEALGKRVRKAQG